MNNWKNILIALAFAGAGLYGYNQYTKTQKDKAAYEVCTEISNRADAQTCDNIKLIDYGSMFKKSYGGILFPDIESNQNTRTIVIEETDEITSWQFLD